MKPVGGTGILLSLVMLSIFSLAVCSGWCVLSLRQYREVQGELVTAEQNRSWLRLLVADCPEYRKRNPAMEPLLQSANVLRVPGTNPPAQYR